MFPDWLRVILLFLTLVSFLPQFHQICARKNASGIALSYVLLNLIAATEQFAVNFGYIALISPRAGIFVHDPATVGDWLNLAQTTLVWLLFVVYFALCLSFPSQSNYNRKRVMLGLYIAYFVVAIIPLFLCAIVLKADDDKSAYREWPVVLTFTPHMLWLTYVGTVLVIMATYRQAQAILHPDPSESQSQAALASESESTSQVPFPVKDNSLSVCVLAIQSVLFILLAVSWIFRVVFPPLPEGATWWDSRVVKVWFEMVGSIAVDNAVFGIGQGLLLFLLLRSGRGGGDGAAGEGEDALGTEREPLLRRAT